jgi:hypothetical protein
MFMPTINIIDKQGGDNMTATRIKYEKELIEEVKNLPTELRQGVNG